MSIPPLYLTWALASPATAALTLVQELDSFDSGPSPLVLSSGSQTQNYQDPSGAIPGEWRSVEVTVTANPFSQNATAGVSATTEQYFTELGPGVVADLSLTYDANQVGLGGLDLTAGGATSLAFLVADSDANLEVFVTITDTSGEVATLLFQQGPALTSDTLANLPFASFDNAANTDLTQVDSLRFDFDNGVAGDFTFRTLGTYAIPEPSALILLSTAGILFGRRRRNP